MWPVVPSVCLSDRSSRSSCLSRSHMMPACLHGQANLRLAACTLAWAGGWPRSSHAASACPPFRTMSHLISVLSTSSVAWSDCGVLDRVGWWLVVVVVGFVRAVQDDVCRCAFRRLPRAMHTPLRTLPPPNTAYTWWPAWPCALHTSVVHVHAHAHHSHFFPRTLTTHACILPLLTNTSLARSDDGCDIVPVPANGTCADVPATMVAPVDAGFGAEPHDEAGSLAHLHPHPTNNPGAHSRGTQRRCGLPQWLSLQWRVR